MKKAEVTAQVPEKKDKDGVVTQVAIPAMTISVDYPESLNEAGQMYGEEAVLSNAWSSWKVTLQSNMRSGMKRGETVDQLQARLSTSKMGVASAGIRVDPETAFLAQFASATPEKRKEMLAKLKALSAA